MVNWVTLMATGVLSKQTFLRDHSWGAGGVPASACRAPHQQRKVPPQPPRPATGFASGARQTGVEKAIRPLGSSICAAISYLSPNREDAEGESCIRQDSRRLDSGVRSVSSVYPTSSTLAVASLDDLQWLEINSSVNDLMHDGILLNLNISRPFLSAIWPISDESCGPLAEIKQNTRGIGRIGIWGPKRSWHFRGTAEN